MEKELKYLHVISWCSFTARKGLNILIYWIIVQVLLSSRPYQASGVGVAKGPKIKSDKYFLFNHFGTISFLKWGLVLKTTGWTPKLAVLSQNDPHFYLTHIYTLLLPFFIPFKTPTRGFYTCFVSIETCDSTLWQKFHNSPHGLPLQCHFYVCHP